MRPSIRSRVIGSGVAFLLGFAIANLALLGVPSPDHWLLISVAAMFIVTAGIGIVLADSPRGFSVWALLGVELFLLFTLLPVVWLFSLATGGDGAKTLLPTSVNLDAFGDALQVAGIKDAMGHSLLAAAIATLIAVPVGLGAAYVLARGRPAGHRPARWIVTAILLAPLITWTVPMSHQVRELGVVGSPLVTALGTLVVALPLAIWLLIGVLEAAHWELHESAIADGADSRAALRAVLLPQLWPGVLATTVAVFVAACLDFVVGAGVSAADGPLPVTLLTLAGEPATVAAVGLVWMLPMAVAVGLFASWITRLVGRS